jgi:hypothetical protein
MDLLPSSARPRYPLAAPLANGFLRDAPGSGWTLSFSLPIVAIVFLATRAMRREPKPAEAF